MRLALSTICNRVGGTPSRNRYIQGQDEGVQQKNISILPGEAKIAIMLGTDDIHAGKVVNILFGMDDFPLSLVLRGQRSGKLVLEHLVIRTDRRRSLEVERVGSGPHVTVGTGGQTVEAGQFLVVVASDHRRSRGQQGQ